jgi:formate hydrogenlyase subunit 3/multisubunit Na+/H+ antiporter MnhD subunit
VSAPLIWIILPGAAAVGLLGLRRWPRIQWVTGLVVTLLLALLAWRLPIGQLVILGPLNFKIEPTLAVLGRKFTILDAARPGLQAIYLIAAFWFGGAIMARPGRLFIPMGLAILALLTAAVAVTPLLYAALLIEVAVLVSIPLLAAAGQPLGQGVLRYLSFQTLGMPFILLTGGLLVGIETDPGNPELVRRVGLLLALGFSLLLAIFPFHTWIPRLTEEAHPYAAAFVLLILP